MYKLIVKYFSISMHNVQPASHAMVLLSVLGLAAGFLTLTLPETLDQPLPEALADVEQRIITA